MRKVPTLFLRDEARPGRPVTDQVNPACAWVFDDQGHVTARQKLDGTCVLLEEDGTWWARREVRPGRQVPDGYRPVETDPVTGKTFGWEPIAQSPFVKAFREALEHLVEESSHRSWSGDNTEPLDPSAVPAYSPTYEPGTYELIGPKINGNPEWADHHELIAHDGNKPWSAPIVCAPLATPEEVIAEVRLLWDDLGGEGLVFTHDDGRRAKIKARDLEGLVR